jgi:SAM-dependent methyltransferase
MVMRPIRFPDFDDGELTPVDALMRCPPAEQVAAAIRSGICPNERFFDRFLPYELRCVSGQFWTPLPVALRVAQWLDAEGVETVVDVGSGAGKFCVAAALASRCTFIGVEQRPRFVAAARALAGLFGVSDRARFVSGTLGSGVLPVADAYYLYNPFGENLFGPEEHLDEDVELCNERYERDIAFMERFFAQAPDGTLVVKYNGFGGQMPFSYDELHVARDLPNLLRMWRKRAPEPADPMT